MAMKAIKLVLQILIYVFTCAEAIAPLVFTFPQVIADKSVGQNTCLPHLIIWLNGIVQLVCAVRKHDFLAIVAYSIVLLASTFCCILYLRYSNGVNRAITCGIAMLLIGSIGTAVFIPMALFGPGPFSPPIEYVYWMISYVTEFLVFVSPVVDVCRAYRTNELEGVDILLSILLLGKSIATVVSGCLSYNTIEFEFGVIGILFAAGQLYVWRRCYRAKRQHKSK